MASTEPSTEVRPFTPHIKETCLGLSLLIKDKPVGKGMPSKNPMGAKNSTVKRMRE